MRSNNDSPTTYADNRPGRAGVFLTYPGGKARLARHIVEHMAPHRVYVEPFSGTASVLFAKSRAPFEMLNDRDGYLVTLLRVVRDRPDELARALSLTPYARDEYQAADPSTATDDVEVARRVCVRIGQSFAKSGLAAPGQGWRMSTTVGRSVAATWADMPGKVLAACERLRGVHIENGDALSVIERYGRDATALLYVDPPYLAAARNAPKIYRHEMGGEDEHRHLAQALNECRAHVLLSGYHDPLYAEMFAGWEHVEFTAVANHNGSAEARPQRIEVLWSNRPLATQTALEIA